MADSLKIGVVGASGRMGRMLINIISNTSGCEIAGATEAPDSESLGEDSGILAGVGENNIPIIDNPKEMFAVVDVVINPIQDIYRTTALERNKHIINPSPPPPG